MLYGVHDNQSGYTMQCINLGRALQNYRHLQKTWPDTTLFVKREHANALWKEACPEFEEDGTCIHSDHTK